MNKLLILAVVVGAFVASTNFAYAKVSDVEKTTGKPESVVTKLQTLKETIAAKKAQMQERVKVKNVQHLYFYEEAVIEEAGDTGRAEYTMWGKMIYNVKKQMVVFNAHGLEKDTEYTLQYGDQTATGTANEYGDLHIKATIEVEAWDERGEFALVTAVENGTTVLVEHNSKIKPLAEMEEMDGDTETME